VASTRLIIHSRGTGDPAETSVFYDDLGTFQGVNGDHLWGIVALGTCKHYAIKGVFSDLQGHELWLHAHPLTERDHVYDRIHVNLEELHPQSHLLLHRIHILYQIESILQTPTDDSFLFRLLSSKHRISLSTPCLPICKERTVDASCYEIIHSLSSKVLKHFFLRALLVVNGIELELLMIKPILLYVKSVVLFVNFFNSEIFSSSFNLAARLQPATDLDPRILTDLVSGFFHLSLSNVT